MLKISISGASRSASEGSMISSPTRTCPAISASTASGASSSSSGSESSSVSRGRTTSSSRSTRSSTPSSSETGSVGPAPSPDRGGSSLLAATCTSWSPSCVSCPNAADLSRAPSAPCRNSGGGVTLLGEGMPEIRSSRRSVTALSLREGSETDAARGRVSRDPGMRAGDMGACLGSCRGGRVARGCFAPASSAPSSRNRIRGGGESVLTSSGGIWAVSSEGASMDSSASRSMPETETLACFTSSCTPAAASSDKAMGVSGSSSSWNSSIPSRSSRSRSSSSRSAASTNSSTSSSTSSFWVSSISSCIAARGS